MNQGREFSRREFLAFGGALAVVRSPFHHLPWWRPKEVAIAGARFRIVRSKLKHKPSRRRYLLIHGDERTAREVLLQHMRTHSGVAFVTESQTRNVPIASGQIDPNRMFSRRGAEASLRSLNPDWTAGQMGAALDLLDGERERFLDALAGVSDPETKRKIIGREFIRCFEQAARDLVGSVDGSGHPIEWLVQGTLYPDVVESGGGTGTASIKSHHNVGGLPDDLQFNLIEPLRMLFKDEVRQVGLKLGVPEAIVWRQPFPGPGLAIRIVGEVTAERLAILRAADAIAREELTAAGLDRDIWQCPVVLLADVRSVGVQGDGRSYGHPIVLRPVSSEDAMTADWTRVPYDVLARISTRITNEVSEVNRVVLDVTSKPPGTIEWE